MLTIKNFKRLEGDMIGEWSISQATTADKVGQGSDDRYILTLRRGAIGDGAAVFISRKESELSTYSVQIMYEAWDNIIFQRYLDSTQIQRKDAFLGMILNAINTEHYSRRKLKP
jgi:hypothetical protein